MYKSAIYKTKNKYFMAENVNSILKFIQLMPDNPKKIQLLAKIIDFINKNNARTLRADGIKTLLEIMKKHNLGNKDILLNILPNLPTLIEENIEHIANQTPEIIRDKIYNYY